MKKIAIILLLAATMLTLAACNSSPTVTAAWADVEELTYDITTNADGSVIGTLEMFMQRSPADKNLNGKDYSAADSKMIMRYETDKHFIETVSLVKGYVILATEKNYTDKVDADKSYKLNAYHDGKYYYYSMNGESQRINVGKTNYSDGEFIYNFLRSYTVTAVPSSIKVADPMTKTALALSASNKGTQTIKDVPYPSGARDINCNLVEISLSGSPSGRTISVWYAPDTAEQNLSGLSLNESKKIPVRMQENDITYVLKLINVR